MRGNNTFDINCAINVCNAIVFVNCRKPESSATNFFCSGARSVGTGLVIINGVTAYCSELNIQTEDRVEPRYRIQRFTAEIAAAVAHSAFIEQVVGYKIEFSPPDYF